MRRPPERQCRSGGSRIFRGFLSGLLLGGARSALDRRPVANGRQPTGTIQQAWGNPSESPQTNTRHRGHSAGSDTWNANSSKPIYERTIDFNDGKALEKELGDAQRRFAHLSHEEYVTVTSDGKVWSAVGGEQGVDTRAIQEAGSSLTGSYSYHNHPAHTTRYSFSEDDVRFFFDVGEAYSRASDDVFEYVMRRTPETVDVDSDTAYSRFKEIYRMEIMELSYLGKIDIDADGYHETMKRLSKEYKFDYRRRALDGIE